MTSQPSIHALIEAVRAADSARALAGAVRNLAQTRSPEAIPLLIEALGYNNPGAAVAAVEGLVGLGELAVPAILEQLDGYNYGARAWGIRALAAIGDPRGLDILTEAAKNDFALSVRRAAARGLGNILWDRLEATPREQERERVHHCLIQVAEDPEWVVRYAAVVGIEGLVKNGRSPEPSWVPQSLARLERLSSEDEVLVVRARALLACQNLQTGVTAGVN
jgi:phycocyanobilin lyase beta subunit